MKMGAGTLTFRNTAIYVILEDVRVYFTGDYGDNSDPSIETTLVSNNTKQRRL